MEILGIILAVVGIGVAIYYGVKSVSKESFKKEFPEMVKKAVKEKLETYLNGLPNIRNKDKQNVLKIAIKEMENNNYEKAISQFEKYMNEFRLDDSERCSILNFIGLSQNKMSENEKAKSTLGEMILIAERIKEDEALVKGNGNIGIVYRELGEYEKAIEYHQKALEIDRRINNPLGEAQDLGNLGNVYIQLKSYEKALEFLSKAKGIFSRLGIKNMIQKTDKLIEKVSKHLK